MSKHTAAVEELLRDLVLANRILAQQGVVDAFGHISARHPDDPGRYFLACSRAPEQVELDDLIEFNLDGEPTTPETRTLYGERAIHSRIYAKRPDVGSVCHNHSHATIPFGVTGIPIRPIWHQAAPIGYDIPIWDTRTEFGSTSMLVTTKPMGDSLATALGENRALLMRGHGTAVTGGNIREAVYTAIYLQENAKLLTTSLTMSQNVIYMDREEVALAGAVQFSPRAQERAWSAWVARVT
jgi:HCOMODA/2-hydroxy-3-carboxy-muconic semialdehyde decarboxylase